MCPPLISAGEKKRLMRRLLSTYQQPFCVPMTPSVPLMQWVRTFMPSVVNPSQP